MKGCMVSVCSALHTESLRLMLGKLFSVCLYVYRFNRALLFAVVQSTDEALLSLKFWFINKCYS